MISVKNVTKEYVTGGASVVALDNVSFEVDAGEFAVILGPSGSGKSTILNLLGGMDRPTDGVIEVDGEVISNLSDKELTCYRRDTVGFIFQFYNLVSNLTVYENVGIAAKLTNNVDKVHEILEAVGLKEKADKFPQQLSGGEMQRVAIARAVAKSPKLLLCDEPTGALDSNTGILILKLLQKMAKSVHSAVIVVTHNSSIATVADKVIQIKDGKITEMIKNENPKEIDEVVW